MKALVYDGPREVVVKDVPDAKIEHPTDALVKITTTNICGSDLHMYEGRTNLVPGMVLGHENLGIVAEVGSAVVKLSPGDRVCVPFNIGCGFCRNCEQGLTADYVMLSDIFPTGWHCTRLADMQPGDSVVVYGAGPVGLTAAYSAMIQGASKVMIVDRHPDRLRLAEQIGVIPIDDSQGDPVEQVLEQTRGRGADKGCECVGYQAHDPQGHETRR